MHIRHVLLAFFTKITGKPYPLADGRIKPFCKSISTCRIYSRSFSSDIGYELILTGVASPILISWEIARLGRSASGSESLKTSRKRLRIRPIVSSSYLGSAHSFPFSACRSTKSVLSVPLFRITLAACLALIRLSFLLAKACPSLSGNSSIRCVLKRSRSFITKVT
jgi:hypothetical protein